MNTGPLFVNIQRDLAAGKYALAAKRVGELDGHQARCLAASACMMVGQLLAELDPEERQARLEAWGLYAQQTMEPQ